MTLLGTVEADITRAISTWGSTGLAMLHCYMHSCKPKLGNGGRRTPTPAVPANDRLILADDKNKHEGDT